MCAALHAGCADAPFFNLCACVFVAVCVCVCAYSAYTQLYCNAHLQHVCMGFVYAV